jgi:hypothetical protein
MSKNPGLWLSGYNEGFETLDEARVHDPAVNNWLTLADTGRMTRAEALEGLALWLANEKARLLDDLKRRLAAEPPTPIPVKP